MKLNSLVFPSFLLFLVCLVAAAMGLATHYASSALAGESAKSPTNEVVVLVHGLGRTPVSLVTLEWTLEREGYEVVNWGYSSFCCDLDELGAQLSAQVAEVSAAGPEQIHFVGHSMGNILVRWMLHNNPPDQPGRVVMLAPPNQGSAVADRYADWFGWILDPLPDLVTGEEGAAQQLPPIEDRELGIIAGRFDGKVEIEETYQATQDDHRVVDAAHTLIMNRPDVHRLVVAFLATGMFPEE